MKKILFLMMFVLVMTGCSKNSIIESNPFPNNPDIQENQEFDISLGLSYEDVDIEESPLSKANITNSNDIYAVQVYSTAIGSNKRNYYAAGLFDNKSDMKIKLLAGYKYDFECTLIIDAKNILYSSGLDYSYPFDMANTRSILNNAFTYSSTMFFYSLRSSGIKTKDNEFIKKPEIERYFGDYYSYIPTENASITIELKKAIFGIKVIAEGLLEGAIKITIGQQSVIHYITYPEVDTQYTPSMDMGNKLGEEYTNTELTEITWLKSDGTPILLMSKDITYKRNKLTTITVKVKDGSTENGMNISKENTAMTNGDHFVLNEKGEIISNINPQ